MVNSFVVKRYVAYHYMCTMLDFSGVSESYVGPVYTVMLLVTKSNDNHFDSEGDYGTGCRNVSHCQQQQFRTVHPDNHTQPTYEKTPGFKPLTVMIMMEYSENLPLKQFLTLIILLLQGVDQTPEKSQIKVWHQIGHEFSILVKEKDKATSF